MKIIIDLLVLSALFYYIYQGARRGFLLSLLGVLSIICSYAGAVLFSQPGGAWIEARWGADPLTARMAAGVGGFIAIVLAFSIVQWVTKRLITRKGEDGKRRIPLKLASRIGGALISLSLAVLLLAVLWWVLDALRVSLGERMPAMDGSITERLGQSVVRGVAGVALSGQLDDEQAKLAADLISSPSDSTAKLKALLDEPAVKALFASSAFLVAFQSGEESRIAENVEFVALFEDPSVLEMLQELGFIPADVDLVELRTSLGGELAKAGKRWNAVKEDPEVKEALAELEKEATLEELNLQVLVFDKRIRKIAAKALAPIQE